MTEPTTPTGKRFVRGPDTIAHEGHIRIRLRDIIAIEHEAAEAQAQRSIAHDIKVKAERNAARALADQLAEALKETGECWCPAADDPARDEKCIRCAALAAYEEARK